MKKGDIYKFGFISEYSSLNFKNVLFLGDEWCYPEEGFAVRNYKILILGDLMPVTIDKNLVRYMTPI
jgi:hypothetical protein